MESFPLHNLVKSPAAEISFRIDSTFTPSGDQPKAIESLWKNLSKGVFNQVLLGVTGSGKTFTMAHIIEKMQCPCLIMAPNKTLAAQLYTEMKGFFPDNAVEYFVSYYDYYQPEAYIPKRDIYIEKEATINEQIDRMRHSATRSLLERRDVVIVASVSCIYGIGSVETYANMIVSIDKEQAISQRTLIRQIVDLQYRRNDTDFSRGTFRVRGDIIEIFPVHLENCAWRVSLFGDAVETITAFDPLTGKKIEALEKIKIYPNSHYVTPRPTLKRAIESIRKELKKHLHFLYQEKKLLEAQRLEQRTQFDLEMMETTGMCPGIENYSRHLTGRAPGRAPPTLFEYLPEDALLMVDESHVTVPQIGGMYRGDFNRKTTLSTHGFRLPSCIDNRPLKFEEWESMRPKTVFTSATPGDWELEKTNGVVAEQVIRPTGLLDPECIIRPAEHQVDDLLEECRKCTALNQRVLVTTLTKRMAENLSEYMQEAGLRVRYLHSDIETLERIDIIRDLRQGVFDILIGINLLREGLDIPECALVGILDADKEGFLRSQRSLIQTIGRASRNVEGRVILYADKITKSMDHAISETNRRRKKQKAYNTKYQITPESIKSKIHDALNNVFEKDHVTIPTSKLSLPSLSGMRVGNYITLLEKTMYHAATALEFEKAASIRDEIHKLETHNLDFPADSVSLNMDIAESLFAEKTTIQISSKKRKKTRK